MKKDVKASIFEERICMYLMLLKITPNLKGYFYIKECAVQIFQNSKKKHNISNELFDDVAKNLNINRLLIERSLRHAIEVSWRRHGIADFEKMMKCEFCRDKPSPRELICVLVERASMECNTLLLNSKQLCEKWKESFIDY